MTADQRLTLDQCVPGRKLLGRNGSEYTIEDVDEDDETVDVVELPGGSWSLDNFERLILADPPQPVLTEELREALVWLHGILADVRKAGMPMLKHEVVIYGAIERAGILPSAPPAALPAMWCGADAFEGEG